MLAPYNAILVHKTLCQTHVGPMLGPSWAHTTLYWSYLGPMLAPCYAHVGPFSSTYKFLTFFKNHGKTQYSRAKKAPPPKLKLYQWLSHDFRTPSPQKTPQHLRCGRIFVAKFQNSPCFFVCKFQDFSTIQSMSNVSRMFFHTLSFSRDPFLSQMFSFHQSGLGPAKGRQSRSQGRSVGTCTKTGIEPSILWEFMGLSLENIWFVTSYVYCNSSVMQPTIW